MPIEKGVCPGSGCYQIAQCFEADLRGYEAGFHEGCACSAKSVGSLAAGHSLNLVLKAVQIVYRRLLPIMAIAQSCAAGAHERVMVVMAAVG